MSQSPTGISSIRTWNEYDGGWIVSRKLSHVGSFGPLHPPAVAIANAPVQETDVFEPETVPEPGLAAFDPASGSASVAAATANKKRILRAREAARSFE